MRAANRVTRKPKAKPTPAVGQSLLLHGISWEVYEQLVEAFAEEHVRLTYDDGDLELMAPRINHEWWKRRMSLLLTWYCIEREIGMIGAGSTTFRRVDVRKGAEPDECFYIQNVEKMRGKRDLDLTRDPPPDLVLEVDITTDSLERMPIYAALGVPEVWVYDDESIRLYRLDSKKHYKLSKKSRALPGLPVAELHRYVLDTQDLLDSELMRDFRGWIKKHSLDAKN